MTRLRNPVFVMFLALAASVLGISLLSGCPGGTQAPCECLICSDAVSLTVTDAQNGQAINDFRVELIFNGDPQGEPANCSVGQREGNGCTFGPGPGLYHVMVSAPGYTLREAVVRVAAAASGDLCCLACLLPREIALQLDPL